MKAPEPVSNFDCEKDITSAFNSNLFVVSELAPLQNGPLEKCDDDDDDCYKDNYAKTATRVTPIANFKTNEWAGVGSDSEVHEFNKEGGVVPYVMKRYKALAEDLGLKTKCAVGEYDHGGALNLLGDDDGGEDGISSGYDTWIEPFDISTAQMVEYCQDPIKAKVRWRRKLTRPDPGA